MARLKFSHSENWCGLVSDFYYCSDCIQQYAFQHGTLPEIEKCSNCGAEFEGADFNDQIGG